MASALPPPPAPTPPPAPRSRALRAFELAAVAAFGATAATLGSGLAALPPAPWWPLLALAALAGVALADLGSGVVHWFCDTFFTPETPGIGRLLIAPFREHHVDPLGITRHGPLEVSGFNAALGVPLLAAGLPLADAFGHALVPSALLVLWSTTVGAVVATNQLHAWAHAPRPPRAVAWLQRCGLALPPAHHARHHRAGRGAYCVTVGWCNPLLDGSGVLPRVEATVARARRRLPSGRGARPGAPARTPSAPAAPRDG